MIVLAAPMSHAQVRAQFDLPAQPLAVALRAVGSQTSTNVLFDPPLVEGLDAPEIKAELTLSEAFAWLLAGSGLKHRFLDDKTVMVISGTASTPADPVSSAFRTRAIRLAQANGPGDSEPASEREGRGFWSRFRIAQAGVDPSSSTAARAQSDQGAETSSAPEIEEVIVTAQKRAERLQDVPISMSVLTGDELDVSTAQGITEALGRVPGVATIEGHQGGGTLVAIRGVSAGAVIFNGSSPIAYYLDSVPFGLVKSAVAPDPNAYDMDRVEVLRGPQGTLYGASAQNGVVRVLSKEADLDRLEFKVRTTVSSTSQASGQNSRADAALNVPIVEGKLAARAVVGYQNLAGWIDKPNDKDANDADLRTFRLKVNAQPTEELSVGLSAWLSRNDFGAPSIGYDSGHSTGLAAEPIATDYSAYGLKIGYEFPAVSVLSMTSYLDYENDGFLDYAPLVPNNILQTNILSKMFSQEITLNSTSPGAWRWSAGAIYRDGKDKLFQDREGYVAYTDLRDYSTSAAVFGEVTRQFAGGKVELTGGLRYFEDDVTSREFQRVTGVPASQLVTDSDRSDKVSPRLVLAWHPHRDMTVYASYAEGFRSGFPQTGSILAVAPDFESLKPDNLKNYEVGAKGALLGGALIFDVAAFYIDWIDVQQTITVNVGTTANPINLTALINGESASGAGVEMALTGRPTERLELGVNVSWNDLGMDNDVRSAGPSAPPGGFLLFNAGDRLNLSSEYVAGASAAYAFPFGSKGYTGRLSTSANYMSSQQYRTIFGGVSIGQGDDILISRASFSIDSPERWSAALFVDNLNDESGTPVATPFAVTYNARVRPRTVGLQFEYRY